MGLSGPTEGSMDVSKVESKSEVVIPLVSSV